MAAIKMSRKDFYSVDEDVRAEALLNRVFPHSEGVMIFESGNEVFAFPITRFLEGHLWERR